MTDPLEKTRKAVHEAIRIRFKGRVMRGILIRCLTVDCRGKPLDHTPMDVTKVIEEDLKEGILVIEDRPYATYLRHHEDSDRDIREAMEASCR